MEKEEKKKLGKKELENRVNELEQLVKNLELEKNEKFEKNVKLEKEILSLKKDKKMAEYQATQLVKEQNRLMKQLRAEQKKNTYKQKTKNLELGKIDQINLEQIKELSRILEEKNVTLEKLEQDNSEKDAEIQFLQTDLADSRNKLKEKEKEFENKLDDLKNSYSMKEQEFEKKINSLNDQLRLKQDTLSDLTNEHNLLQQKFKELEEIAAQKLENIVNKEALESLSKEIALKEAKIAELRLKLKEKISDYDEIRPLQKKMDDKDLEIEQLREQTQKLKQEEKTEITKLQKEISLLRQKNENLQQKLKEIEAVGEDIPFYIVELL
ncbi:MAG: hypothetical protein ACFFCM_00065 [Promethearchaeota archaeon]